LKFESFDLKATHTNHVTVKLGQPLFAITFSCTFMYMNHKNALCTSRLQMYICICMYVCTYVGRPLKRLRRVSLSSFWLCRFLVFLLQKNKQTLASKKSFQVTQKICTWNSHLRNDAKNTWNSHLRNYVHISGRTYDSQTVIHLKGTYFLKRLPGVGSEPGSSQFHLFSNFHHLTAEPQRLPW
jgi:hypothetical protein